MIPEVIAQSVVGLKPGAVPAELADFAQVDLLAGPEPQVENCVVGSRVGSRSGARPGPQVLCSTKLKE